MSRASSWSPSDPAADRRLPSQQHLQFGELHRLLAQFNAIGALPGGGVTRLAASAEDGEARRALIDWLRAHEAQVRIDTVGNVYGLITLAGPDAPWVMCGSHLDSQPASGALDGTYGVLAACCAAQALQQGARQGQRFEANLCVVDWCNEEGARFRPSVLGSSVYAGRCSEDFALARTDADGISLRDALAAIGFLGTDAAPVPHAYFELHVEQGPALEAAGERIGIVARNWGAAKVELVFEGEQAHTGPTPMAARRDALLAAAEVVVAVRALADRWGTPRSPLYTAVGRLSVSPNSSNVVPARAELSIELRCADPAVLSQASKALDAAIEAAAGRAKVVAHIVERGLREPRTLPEAGQQWLAQAAQRLGVSSMVMDTVAGHDALSLLETCPVALLFVPSIGGISHHVDEATAASDLELGLCVLTEALWTACGGATAASGGGSL